MYRNSYKKVEADYLHRISIFKLKKWGLLKSYYASTTITWEGGWGKCAIGIEVVLVANLRAYLMGQEPGEDGHLRIRYTESGQDYDYKARLCLTPCNLGGYRYWLMCPHCEKRVGVLYKNGIYFSCRHCNNLTYESKNVTGRQKAFGRIISEHETESMKNDIKRLFYRGKPTRKFLRYLIKQNKAKMAYESAIMLLSGERITRQ